MEYGSSFTQIVSRHNSYALLCPQVWDWYARFAFIATRERQWKLLGICSMEKTLIDVGHS